LIFLLLLKETIARHKAVKLAGGTKVYPNQAKIPDHTNLDSAHLRKRWSADSDLAVKPLPDEPSSPS
jgi:hypothetical protein